MTGVAANFVAYGIARPWGSIFESDIVPYYDLGGAGAAIVKTNGNFKELA